MQVQKESKKDETCWLAACRCGGLLGHRLEDGFHIEYRNLNKEAGGCKGNKGREIQVGEANFEN